MLSIQQLIKLCCFIKLVQYECLRPVFEYSMSSKYRYDYNTFWWRHVGSFCQLGLDFEVYSIELSFCCLFIDHVILNVCFTNLVVIKYFLHGCNVFFTLTKILVKLMTPPILGFLHSIEFVYSKVDNNHFIWGE